MSYSKAAAEVSGGHLVSGYHIIRSPWEDRFVDLLKNAVSHVYLASPFIKYQTASIISQNIRRNLDFRYINCFKLAHFHSGVSDLSAITLFRACHCRQKSVHNLHAKLYIFDDKAIVTSGNLTSGGLRNNLEYGVLVQNQSVEEIKQDYLRIFTNPDYPDITEQVIEKAQSILDSVPKEKQKTVRLPDNSLFDDIINDENISERFEGGIQSIVSNLSNWEKDVFNCLLKIEKDVFTLDEVYRSERFLSEKHPNNKNVQAKIRQQLQYLRNVGLLEFLRPGEYKKLWVSDND